MSRCRVCQSPPSALPLPETDKTDNVVVDDGYDDVNWLSFHLSRIGFAKIEREREFPLFFFPPPYRGLRRRLLLPLQRQACEASDLAVRSQGTKSPRVASASGTRVASVVRKLATAIGPPSHCPRCPSFSPNFFPRHPSFLASNDILERRRHPTRSGGSGRASPLTIFSQQTIALPSSFISNIAVDKLDERRPTVPTARIPRRASGRSRKVFCYDNDLLSVATLRFDDVHAISVTSTGTSKIRSFREFRSVNSMRGIISFFSGIKTPEEFLGRWRSRRRAHSAKSKAERKRQRQRRRNRSGKRSLRTHKTIRVCQSGFSGIATASPLLLFKRFIRQLFPVLEPEASDAEFRCS